MRIILTSDINYEFVCGSNRFVQTLAQGLKERGHEILLLTPSGDGKAHYYEKDGLRIYGATSMPSLVQSTLRLAPLSFFQTRSLAKVMDEFNPELIHIQSHFMLPFAATRIAKKKGVALFGTNHFVPENVVPAVHIPRFIAGVVEKVMWKHLNWIFGKMGTITTPTETAAAIFRSSGFKKPIHVISNGISLKRFHPDEHGGDYLKKRYQLPYKKILLYIGRLDPEKHIDLVLKALPKVLEKTDLHFVIAGRGAEAQKLKKLCKKLKLEDKVTFAGFVSEEDLPHLYQMADAFVNAGTAELQCISMMEAMATGLPVFGARAGALPELIDQGENGFLFEAGNAEDLAEKLAEVFSDEERMLSMGRRSLDKIKIHDIEKTFTEFETLYVKEIGKEK